MLTPESFDRLLLWLDPDRGRAGEKYEKVRLKLIRRFRQLGCAEPEELANETIDRVAKKLPEVVETYKGDRGPYFFSVALYIYKEHLRRPVAVSLQHSGQLVTDLQQAPGPPDDDELMDSCLRHCMERLTQRSREMILQYYRGERREKIELRKELAERMGIKLTNLRLRAQRIRADLKSCILDCMGRQSLS